MQDFPCIEVLNRACSIQHYKTFGKLQKKKKEEEWPPPSSHFTLCQHAATTLSQDTRKGLSQRSTAMSSFRPQTR